MTRAQQAASQRLADLLTKATGMPWVVDVSATRGEAVIVTDWDTDDWRTKPAVRRNEWREVRVNPNHPTRSEYRNLRERTGKGWQESILPELVHIFGSAEKKP